VSDQDHRTDDERGVDDLTRSRFHTEPVEDHSGMFLPPEPPEDEPPEDERFIAYMQRHFPGRCG
jgi:hypothetical protein